VQHETRCQDFSLGRVLGIKNKFIAVEVFGNKPRPTKLKFQSMTNTNITAFSQAL